MSNNNSENTNFYEDLHELLNDIDETSSKLIHRIANSCSIQEFEVFLKNGEMPAVKLEVEELRAVSGGLMQPTKKTIRQMRKVC